MFLYCVGRERWGQGGHRADEAAVGDIVRGGTMATRGHRCPRLSEVKDGRHGITETPRNPGVRSLKHDNLSLPEPRRSNPLPEINGRQHKLCLTYIVKLWENFAGHFRGMAVLAWLFEYRKWIYFFVCLYLKPSVSGDADIYYWKYNLWRYECVHNVKFDIHKPQYN